MINKSAHWDDIFSTKSGNQLGWFEQDLSQTLKFLQGISLNAKTNVFLPGAGTSTLVDFLYEQKCKSLILNDISEQALHQLEARLGANNSVQFFHHNMAKPFSTKVSDIDLWIDRAVLHFLLSENEITGYFENLHNSVNVGGHVLLAEFSTEGAPKCAGLDVHRYSLEELVTRMGCDFELINHEAYTFMNPFGDARPYIYALFTRTS